MKRKILIGLTVVILVALGFYGSYRFVNDLNKCWMSAGPCFGQQIHLNLNTTKVDQYLDCPNGRIGFVSTQDTLSPIVFKIDNTLKLLWALRLETDSCSGIPLKQMSGMEILEGNGLKRIHFFNHKILSQ